MWELDHQESWVPKNWCFWTVVLEKTLVSPLDCKEIQPVNPKGNQSWIFTGRTHAEAETLIFWPPDVKNRFIGKDPDAGKDRRLEKVTTEDKMVGWHHRLDGHEFEQAPEVEGQGSLVCCNTWDLKELDTTEQLNWKEESSKEENLLVTHKPARWQYTVGLGQVSSEVCVCSEGYVHSASNRGEERVQDLYTENYNSLLRSIKKELNSWKTIPYSSIRRFNLIRCQYSMNRSKHSKNPFQNPRWCFAETDNQSKMHVENARGSK